MKQRVRVARVNYAVASGQVCYICEKAPATVDDGIGGRLCGGCHAGIVAMLAQYDRANGYHPRADVERQANL